MVAIFGFSKADVTSAVRQMYADVAARPESDFHFPVGRPASIAVGYPEPVIDNVPAPALSAFAGVGYPHAAGVIKPGDVVLDIGAGSGTDSLIACRQVGPAGRVIALDITPDMLERLRGVIAAEGIGTIETIVGDAEHLPLPDASVDVVTSNGALNLVPDKAKCFAEIFRVLKPEGRVQLSDVVIRRPVPLGGRSDPKLWAECVVGASVDDDYLDLFRNAGFEDIQVLGSRDYFAESPSADTRQIAATLGARSIDVVMRRPARPTQPTWFARTLNRLHPRRLKAIGQRGLWGAVATVAALIACYGTMAMLSILATLGVGISLNEGVWAVTVAAAAALAIAATGYNAGRHKAPWALGLVIPGGVAVIYAMLVSYHPAVEAIGFAVLIAGVALDLYLLYRAELCR